MKPWSARPAEHDALSRPAWARGLKPVQQKRLKRMKPSRPAWARGLKLSEQMKHKELHGRAPRGRVD